LRYDRHTPSISDGSASFHMILRFNTQRLAGWAGLDPLPAPRAW